MTNDPTYFSDDPIASHDKDLLNRSSFIDRIVNSLRASALNGSSRVCALIGPWGSGKSSALALLEEKLREEASSWKVAHFNPWSYSDEVSMQFGFFAELKSALPAEGKGKKARVAVAKLSASLAPLAGAVGAFVNVDGTALLEKISAIAAGDSSATKAFTDARDALAKSETPILVILDDLDRLSPGELMLTAKLVRLVGRLPNVFYLLSYDEKTLLDTLARTDLVGDESRAMDYLEKIVQVRFDLPPLSHDQAQTLVEEKLVLLESRLRLEPSKVERFRFMRSYATTLAPRLRTPRAITRFFAQLDQFDTSLAEEINAVDYILLTWIRVAEPLLYELLFENKSWVLGSTRKTEPFVGAAGREESVERRFQILIERFESVGVTRAKSETTITLLTDLFPAIRSDFHRRSSREIADESYGRSKRLAHPDYFDRYFAHDVPLNDVPDRLIETATIALLDGTRNPALAELEQALQTKTSLTVRKLQREAISPAPLISWLFSQLDNLADEGSMLAPRLVVESFIEDSFMRLQAEAMDDLISSLARSKNGQSLLIGLGHRLSTDRESTAMYAHVSIEKVQLLWNHLCSALPQILLTSIDQPTALSPFDLSSGWVDNLLLLETLQPGSGRSWLEGKRSQGWELLDEIASTLPTVQSSRSETTLLGELSHDAFGRLFDTELVRSTLHSEWTPKFVSHRAAARLEDTIENRREAALGGLSVYFRENPAAEPER